LVGTGLVGTELVDTGSGDADCVLMRFLTLFLNLWSEQRDGGPIRAQDKRGDEEELLAQNQRKGCNFLLDGRYFRSVIPGVQACGAKRFLADCRYYRLHHVLTRSELDHAQGILDALFKSILRDQGAESSCPICKAMRR